MCFWWLSVRILFFSSNQGVPQWPACTWLAKLLVRDHVTSVHVLLFVRGSNFAFWFLRPWSQSLWQLYPKVGMTIQNNILKVLHNGFVSSVLQHCIYANLKISDQTQVWNCYEPFRKMQTHQLTCSRFSWHKDTLLFKKHLGVYGFGKSSWNVVRYLCYFSGKIHVIQSHWKNACFCSSNTSQ